MKGRIIIGSILASACAMAIGLWYSIEYAYYYSMPTQDSIIVNGEEREIVAFQGIDSSSSPLKMRACFKVNWPYVYDQKYKSVAIPLIAPRQFDCFDAAQIGEDIKNARATALLASHNIQYGFDQFIAQYPDGRAYMWRQINACGQAYFYGKAIPQNCDIPQEAELKNIMRNPSDAIFTLKLMPRHGGTPQEMAIDGVPDAVWSTDGKEYFSCFTTPMSLNFLRDTYLISDDVRPDQKYDHQPCNHHDNNIAQDIALGVAVAFVGERNIIDGYDRIIAVYADGRAFAWHQKVIK